MEIELLAGGEFVGGTDFLLDRQLSPGTPSSNNAGDFPQRCDSRRLLHEKECRDEYEGKTKHRSIRHKRHSIVVGTRGVRHEDTACGKGRPTRRKRSWKRELDRKASMLGSM